MQAILTKYIPSIDDNGAKMIAFGFNTQTTIDYNEDFELEENHLNSAVELCDLVSLGEDMIQSIVTGELYCSDYVHVFTKGNK